MFANMTQLLLVDNEPRNLQLMRSLLESNGYGVVTATDGFSALEIVRNGQVRAVLADLRTGSMDGLAFLREVMKSNPGLPVVLLTEEVGFEAALAAMQEGVFDYLVKPFRVDELLSCLRRAEGREAGGERVLLKGFLRKKEKECIGELLSAADEADDRAAAAMKSSLAALDSRLSAES